MANDNGNKKQRQQPKGLTAQDVADMFQSAAWYATQNGIPVETETGGECLVIRLPTMQAIETDGVLCYKVKE